MAGWQRHEGQAIALDRENIDTDQLIPARFMSTPRSAGYGRFLLHDLRYDPEGGERPEFPLNQHPKASILVTGRNFGSGSSREAAVYALVDFGIRVVIAPSFGDIFAANAVNNGLLPALVTETDDLKRALSDGPQPATADLIDQTVMVGDVALPFHIDPAARDKLLNGWDDIDLTQTHGPAIAAFRAERHRSAPWVFPQTQIEP